jgi:hypothetical protein
VSDRLRELAERQAELQLRCEAQRALVAGEVAAIEERFETVDRGVRLARKTLLNPGVILGGIVVLLTFARVRGLRLIGRAVLLGAAARRLVNTVKRL